MNTLTKKGFTLIEMAVVLLIIGVLAGIVLRNPGGFGVQARDTRKISDLQLINNYVAQYYTNFGHFPTGSGYTALRDKLSSIGVKSSLISDNIIYYPCATGSGFSTSTNPNHYILGITLEQSTSSAPKLYENTINSNNSLTDEPGWACGDNNTITCQHSERKACFAY